MTIMGIAGIAGIAATALPMVLFLRNRRQAKRRRHYTPVRIFTPGSDPFNDRLEFHIRKESFTLASGKK